VKEVWAGISTAHISGIGWRQFGRGQVDVIDELTMASFVEAEAVKGITFDPLQRGQHHRWHLARWSSQAILLC